MRAFIGQFDRVSLGISLLGGGIGAVWLLAMDLGIALAAFTILIGGVGLAVVVGAWDFLEARRRERLELRHQRRRTRQIADS